MSTLMNIARTIQKCPASLIGVFLTPFWSVDVRANAVCAVEPHIRNLIFAGVS